MAKHLYEAIATLVGMTIGAGILGIPYVVAKSGFLVGVIDILIIGLAVMMMNLLLGEISLRTRGCHQLTGYAEKYLGKKGRIAMFLLMIFGMYGALVAYIIQEGEFLSRIFMPVFGGSPIIYSLVFFAAFTVLVFLGLKFIEKSELLLGIIVLAIVAVLFIFSLHAINTSNLATYDFTKIFVPFGVVMFAFLATSAIPELREELGKDRKALKKAIIIGTIIPIVVYIVFALIVVGVSGVNTTDGAIVGLASALGPKMLLLGLIFGILTMSTSFLAVGLALKEMYHYDFKLNKSMASGLSCFIPLGIALLLLISKVKDPFFQVLDITGAIDGSLTGLLVVWMFMKAKKLGERKPEYEIKSNLFLEILLICVFLSGGLYYILSKFGFF